MKNDINVIITGLEQLKRDLDQLEPEAGNALQEIANDLRDRYKTEILSARAFVTGDLYENARAFVQSNHRIDSKTAHGVVNAREFAIGSDTGYSAYVEFGVESRNYRPRHLLRKAIEATDDHTEKRLFSAFDRALKGAE